MDLVLESIRAVNFVGVKSAALTFDRPLAFLLGEHRSGKTSVADRALEFALTGTCSGIRTKTAAAQAVVGDHGSTAEVELVFNTLKVRRATGAEGETLQVWACDEESNQLEPVHGGMADKQAAVEIALGIPLALVPLVLRGEAFLALAEDARRKAIQLMARPDTSKQKLLECFAQHQVEPTAELLGTLSVLAKLGPKKALEHAVEERRLAKRSAAQLEAATAEPDARFDGLDLREAPPAADLREALAAVKRQLEDAVRDRGHDKGVLQGQLDRAQSQRDHYAGQLAALRPPQPVDFDAEGALAEIGRLDQEIEHAVSFVNSNRQVAETAEALLGDEPVALPPCPVFPGRPTCLAAKDKVAKYLGTFATEAKQIQEKVADRQREVARLRERRAELQSEIAKARETKRNQAQYETQSTALKGRIAEMDDEIAGLGQLLASAADDSGAQAEAIRALRDRVARGERMVDARRRYEDAVETVAVNRDKLAAARLAVTVWDQIASALDPAAVPAMMVRDSIGPINDALAEWARELAARGFPIAEPQIGPDLSVSMNDGRYVRDEALLSHSERLRVGWAIQYAFAVLLRWPVLVIDELSTLAAPARQAMIEQLRKLGSRFPRVLVTSASQQAEVVPPPDEIAAESRTYAFKDGVAQQIA